MPPDDPKIALPRGTKRSDAEPLECPFTGAPVPQTNHRGEMTGVALLRPECGPRCALYDRVKNRPGCSGSAAVVAELVAEVLIAAIRKGPPGS